VASIGFVLVLVPPRGQQQKSTHRSERVPRPAVTPRSAVDRQLLHRPVDHARLGEAVNSAHSRVRCHSTCSVRTGSPGMTLMLIHRNHRAPGADRVQAHVRGWAEWSAMNTAPIRLPTMIATTVRRAETATCDRRVRMRLVPRRSARGRVTAFAPPLIPATAPHGRRLCCVYIMQDLQATLRGDFFLARMYVWRCLSAAAASTGRRGPRGAVEGRRHRRHRHRQWRPRCRLAGRSPARSTRWSARRSRCLVLAPAPLRTLEPAGRPPKRMPKYSSSRSPAPPAAFSGPPGAVICSRSRPFIASSSASADNKPARQSTAFRADSEPPRCSQALSPDRRCS
jgi:hypothetical protein